MVFIITVVLLAMDFYYLKNIAGRRLVGLRWWNEVNSQSGDSNWVFESAEPETRQINATDKRFFWLGVYAQPVSWVALGVVAIVKFEFIWLSLVGESCLCRSVLKTVCRMPYACIRHANCHASRTVLTFLPTVIAIVLTVTNTLAFSRCDKFSQASNLATNAFSASGLASSVGGAVLGRFFR